MKAIKNTHSDLFNSSKEREKKGEKNGEKRKKKREKKKANKREYWEGDEVQKKLQNGSHMEVSN